MAWSFSISGTDENDATLKAAVQGFLDAVRAGGMTVGEFQVHAEVRSVPAGEFT